MEGTTRLVGATKLAQHHSPTTKSTALPGHGAPEQRGAAIAWQLARGLHQGTTLFAQQQPRRAPSVQNSPRTPLLTVCAVQNSPCSPEMAQFGAFCPHRESFVPLWSAQHRAGRILYRSHHQEAKQGEFCTEREAEIERATTVLRRDRCEAEGTEGTTGPGRGAGCGRLAGPTQVRGSQRQINFAHNFPRSLFKTAQKRCNSNDANSIFEQAAGELRAKLLRRQQNPGQTNFACNSIGPTFNKPRKRCNSNDANSMFEQAAGELHAKLMIDSQNWAT